MTMKGLHHSEETKRKIRESNIGKNIGKQARLGIKLSDESKKKLSESCKGRWKGLTYEQMYGKEKAEKLIKDRIEKGKLRKGLKLSEEWKKNIGKASAGKNNWNWKGGITPENIRLRGLVEYKLWREAVFKRDKFTCIWCGDNRGGNLEADHILPFSKYPEHRFSIDNGRTLCHDCHVKRHKVNDK